MGYQTNIIKDYRLNNSQKVLPLPLMEITTTEPCNALAKSFLQAASYDLVVLTFHDEHIKSAALPEEP